MPVKYRDVDIVGVNITAVFLDTREKYQTMMWLSVCVCVVCVCVCRHVLHAHVLYESVFMYIHDVILNILRSMIICNVFLSQWDFKILVGRENNKKGFRMNQNIIASTVYIHFTHFNVVC